MAALFVLVTLCSTAADALRVDRNWIRSLDRFVALNYIHSVCLVSVACAFAGIWLTHCERYSYRGVGAVALSSSCVVNSTSPLNAFLW